MSTTSFVASIRPTVDWEAMWADVLLGRTVAEYLDEVYVYGSRGAGAAALMLLSWLVLLVMHCCLAVATRKLGCAVMCCDAQRGCCPATAATIDTAAEAEAEAARGGGGSTRKLDGTMWVATAAGPSSAPRSSPSSAPRTLSARNSRAPILGAQLLGVLAAEFSAQFHASPQVGPRVEQPRYPSRRRLRARSSTPTNRSVLAADAASVLALRSAAGASAATALATARVRLDALSATLSLVVADAAAGTAACDTGEYSSGVDSGIPEEIGFARASSRPPTTRLARAATRGRARRRVGRLWLRRRAAASTRRR